MNPLPIFIYLSLWTGLIQGFHIPRQGRGVNRHAPSESHHAHSTSHHMLPSNRQRRSVSQQNQIFTETLSQDSWVKDKLGNPCDAEPTPEQYATEDVLNVKGRAAQVKALAGNILAAIENFKQKIVSFLSILAKHSFD